MLRNSLTSRFFCSGVACFQPRPTARRVASSKSTCGRIFSSASLSAFCRSPAASCLSLLIASSTSAVIFLTSSSGPASWARRQEERKAIPPETEDLRHAAARSLWSLSFDITLEHAGLERVALEQAVELGAVAPGEARRLGDVAAGDLEDAHQVVALEGAARLVQRRERGVAGVQRLAHQRFRDHLGRRRAPPPARSRSAAGARCPARARRPGAASPRARARARPRRSAARGR